MALDGREYIVLAGCRDLRDNLVLNDNPIVKIEDDKDRELVTNYLNDVLETLGQKS
tara:strand:+ start:392 stop:559 length:168 start_codon:yes stop_codon:yes gene_type:complete